MTATPRFGHRHRLRVGVLGGSFNPAHAGHRHVAETALRRLRLDQVWLMVSPGNPLKPSQGMAPFATRLASARSIADGRRIIATAIEHDLGERYTADSLRALRRRFPLVKFVWLMGADNLAGLPGWRRWMDIARTMPFAVVPRPTYNHRALAGQAAQRLRRYLRPAAAAAELSDHAAPAWSFLPGPQNAISATALRAASSAPLASGAGTIARKPTAEPGAGAKPPAKRRPPKPPATVLAEAAKTPGTPRKKAVAAGPKPRAPRPKAPKVKTEPSVLDRVQAVIVESLEADKAENIIILDLAGRAAFTERMVVATGLADRQISAMATHLQEKLREAGVGRVPVEGAGGSDWVLIDAGDIVIHLFKPEARDLYALEKMWGEELDEVVQA